MRALAARPYNNAAAELGDAGTPLAGGALLCKIYTERKHKWAPRCRSAPPLQVKDESVDLDRMRMSKDLCRICPLLSLAPPPPIPQVPSPSCPYEQELRSCVQLASISCVQLASISAGGPET